MLQKYFDYVQAQKNATTERAMLLQGVANLPPELRIIVFGRLSHKTLGTVVELANATALDSSVPTVLRPMSGMSLRFVRDGNRLKPEGTFEDLNQLTRKYKAEVEEAIIKLSIIMHPVQFPTPEQATRLPYPAFLSSRVHYIHHMRLSIVIPPFGSAWYPSPLFKIQDQIAKLKTWLPSLKTLALDVINKATDDVDLSSKQLMERLPKRGRTTLQAEVAKIAIEVKKMDLKETTMRYLTRTWREDWSWDRNDSKLMESMMKENVQPKNGEGMEVGEVVRRIMEEVGQPWTL